MKQGKQSNLAASIHQRLLNISRQQLWDFNLLLTRYVIERLLYRLSCSRFQNRFVLKGAMLFVLWEMPVSRPTRDLDLLGFGDTTEQSLQQCFAEICQQDVETDGLEFAADTIHISQILNDEEYVGQRIELLAHLGKARIPLQAAQWAAFIRRTRIDVGDHTLATIVPILDGFLSPVLKSVANQQSFAACWSAGGPWQ